MSILRARRDRRAIGARPERRSLRDRRPFRSIAATVIAVLLGTGLAALGAAAPASAHHNTISATAVCAADGKTAKITWKAVNSENRQETITWSSNPSVIAAGATIAPKGNVTGVQTGAKAGETYTLKLKAKWTNDATSTDEWSFKVPSEICDGGGDTKVTICHWTASGKYNRIETDVAGLFHGHEDHSKDIYPAYSFVKNGKTYSGPAQGDQSLLQYPDCVKPPQEIPVPATPAFFDDCGPDNEVFTEPVDTAKIDWTTVYGAGTITVTAKAKPGYVFADGTSEKTWPPFVIDDAPCPIDVPAKPAFTDTCGVDNEVFTEPVDTATVDWTTVYGDGTITVSAKAKPGYIFSDGTSEKTWEPFVIDDKPCPPEIITFGAAPTGSDVCGADNGELNVPTPAKDAHYTFEVEGSIAEGRVVVTAVAEKGWAFDEDQQTQWEFLYPDTPCVEIPAEPDSTDVCGVDDDAIVLPAPVEFVTWTIEGDPRAGAATAVATTAEGHTFSDGTTSKEFSYEFSNEPCVEPTLEGSVATGVCESDVPWISYRVELADPDDQVESRAVTLVLTDGGANTTEIELGDLNEDGVLEGRTLWPGASVDDQGNPTGWPGWEQQADGTWVETDGNFAWARDITTATFVVNPELTVDLAYPPATPDCIAAPPSGGDGSTTAAGNGLASTGFAGGVFAIIAGVILALGAAIVVFVAIRRKRAGSTQGE